MSRNNILLRPFVLLFLLLFACEDDTPAKPDPSPPLEIAYEVVEAFPALGFIKPVGLHDPGDGSNRLFVLEQLGVIHVFENTPTVERSSVALDMRGLVGVVDNGEKGLLSLAFDPDFQNNGHFYVYFTSQLKKIKGPHVFELRVSRFTLNPPSANVVDPATERVVLNFAKTQYAWHNGGQLAFDAAGYLYVGVGDGGEGHLAQDPLSFFGSILRIDVSSLPYRIPEGNAFPGREIFAYGFRNPWRLSIDHQTGRIWCGDVGSNRFEEVNIIEVGKNYGWWCREGSNDNVSCNETPEYQDPIWEYSHDIGTAIIGGYVVRGEALPTLDGKYVFSDFTSRQLWALEYSGGSATHEVLSWNTGINISSFGLDGSGVLYLTEWNFLGRPDKIYKVVEVEKEAS